MKVEETGIEGLLVITPDKYSDERGYFMETYSSKQFSKAGIFYNFVQDNESVSSGGVLRGLHFQDFPEGQVKLVRCSYGSIIDVAVDVRKNSPTYLQHFKIELSNKNAKMLLIPKGFLHGFIVTSALAKVNYKCSWYYEPNLEKSIRWNDKHINIDWGCLDPILSEKDKDAPLFKDVFLS